jgi:hypothetical protein
MESAFAKVQTEKLELENCVEAGPRKGAVVAPVARLAHHEFYDYTQCRDADLDIRVAREQTWVRFVKSVNTYLKDKTNDMTLVWRIVPEDDLSDTYVVLSHDENGPDKDFITDRRCHTDKGWKKYGIYARFAVTDG